MSNQLTPGEKDVKTVMEAHGVLPDGPMFDEALKVVSLYTDRIQELLSKYVGSCEQKESPPGHSRRGAHAGGFYPEHPRAEVRIAGGENRLIIHSASSASAGSPHVY